MLLSEISMWDAGCSGVQRYRKASALFSRLPYLVLRLLPASLPKGCMTKATTLHRSSLSLITPEQVPNLFYTGTPLLGTKTLVQTPKT